MDIERKRNRYLLLLEMSHNRRNTQSGGGSAGETGDADAIYERFNVNQYYNAVEDEQLYMDEYTSLIQRYNEFIVNGTALYTRMEQTLRENISRAVQRQEYFYRHSDEIRRREGRRLQQSQNPTTSERRREVATTNSTTPMTQLRDIYPRLISRYIATDVARNHREPRPNLFSMLYTAANHPGNRNDGTGPTDEQITNATSNTEFGNIISPVNATCPISRDEFNDDSEITMIRGCNHIFNRESLREWFINHFTCPLCRFDIRQYRTSGSQIAQPSAIPVRNVSVDSMDDNHITFSYDIPNPNYSEDQMYRDIVNSIIGMTSEGGTTNTIRREPRDGPTTTVHQTSNDNDDDNDNDVMDID